MVDYVAVAEQAVQTILAVAEDKSMELVKSTKETKVYAQAVPGMHPKRYRIESEFDAPPARVASLMLVSERTKWDEHVKSMKLLETLADGVTVVHTTMNSAMLGVISSRDFCDAVVFRPLEGTNDLILAGESIEHSGAPHQKDVVRGFLHRGGWIFKSLDNGLRTRMVGVLQVQLGGQLSTSSILDTVMPKMQVSLMEDLRKALKKTVAAAAH
ncbi:hypothetical protein CAOG_04329 [Capsaspora owczarzaki ATCC 30864]|uniref:START domain-containing protein n=1 Tax=Capsaspora owczarzaki (strain ATCC 30864) TaxID=595528 RepID=A0A0D2UEM2_CAPO3|nr:hypothetical protein CAOG_04329 [Capsaspora owczarzaki ATCC 30864]KJE93561.1 hypothetical protein CAOG_004329 [Capsaspora owczarzaki ATCC 30864]|eukprot:XP_004348157.1 hypothetical protein CAOG_04329 [Capsaspora owczarzaki ATCC 30864]